MLRGRLCNSLYCSYTTTRLTFHLNDNIKRNARAVDTQIVEEEFRPDKIARLSRCPLLLTLVAVSDADRGPALEPLICLMPPDADLGCADQRCCVI